MTFFLFLVFAVILQYSVRNSGRTIDRKVYHITPNRAIFTVAELRSTENARCTITIRFVYEYATLYLLHAIPYVRMLRRVYDPNRVSPINYTIFPR